MLLFTRFELGEVDAKVELGELVFAPHLYSIELLRVVAELLLDFLHGLANMCVQESVTAMFILRRQAVRLERICALAFSSFAMVLILVLRFTFKFDATFASGG